MPKYRIKAPNGQSYEIEGPEGASDEQVRAEVLRQFPDAGGQTAAQRPSAFEGVRGALSKVGTQPEQFQGINRGLGRFARMGAEAVGAIPLMAADAGVAARNLIGGGNYELPSSMYGRGLDALRLPRAQGAAEKTVDVLGQMVMGSRLPVPQVKNPAPAAIPLRASTAAAPGAATLENAGVRLDRAQATGEPAWNAVRTASQNHPATAGRQQAFTVNQLKDYTRAVLRRVGINSDEASQAAMLSAKNRTGAVFNSIGAKGAKFDDVLQTEIASIADDMLREVPESSHGVVQRNIDDLLKAVDENGVINGQQFVRIRSHLSKLSSNPDVGQIADDLEDAMLGALQRSYPAERVALNNAIERWRSLRIIEGAVGKGVERHIMPLQLSNAIANKSNRAMRIYGQGGDQYLVKLAEAGRSVLPSTVPDSGTVPRSMLQAQNLVSNLATAIPYRVAQNQLLRQPQQAVPAAGQLPAGSVAPLMEWIKQRYPQESQ